MEIKTLMPYNVRDDPLIYTSRSMKVMITQPDGQKRWSPNEPQNTLLITEDSENKE